MTWNVISKETLHADRFEIEKELIKLDEHKTFNFSYVAVRQGVCILALNEKAEIICIKQYRHTFREELWELPAGAIDGEEQPLDAAKRELEEEAGVQALKWTGLGCFYPSPGSTSEVIYLYLAEQLIETTQQLEETELIHCYTLGQSEFEALISDNQFLHGAGLAAYMKYKLIK